MIDISAKCLAGNLPIFDVSINMLNHTAIMLNDSIPCLFSSCMGRNNRSDHLWAIKATICNNSELLLLKENSQIADVVISLVIFMTGKAKAHSEYLLLSVAENQCCDEMSCFIPTVISSFIFARAVNVQRSSI